jgi:hypothetical protein
MMYKILAVTAIAIGLCAPANAGGLSSRSSSDALAVAGSQSASKAVSLAQGGGGGNVTFNTPANTSQHISTSGTTTIRSAPQVVAPGFSSGHPCAWAPVSVGISVVGFGGAIGGQRIDDACLLAQMGVAPAAILMIAQRNPSACQALLAVGRVRSCRGQSAAVAAPVAQPRYVKASSLPKGTLYRKNGKLYRKS